MVLSMDREIVVKKLTELFRNLNDIEVAILFGSIARGYRHPHDIDIAVKFTTKKSPLDLANLVTHSQTPRYYRRSHRHNRPRLR
mgnify:CR=1 FL=1